MISINGTPRYIGKGRNKRAWWHIDFAKKLITLRARGLKAKAGIFHNKLAKCITSNDRIAVSIIEDGLTDDLAFLREIELIAASPEGQLWNITSGGEGLSRENAIKLRASQSEYFKTPEHRLKIKMASLAALADPIKGARMRAGLAAGGKSPYHKTKWQDPAYRTARHEGHKDSFTPEWRAKQGATRKRLFSDPEFRAYWAKLMATRDMSWTKKNGELIKALWNTPAYRAKHMATRAAPEFRAMRSDQMKDLWADPEYRATTRVGENLRTLNADPEYRKRHLEIHGSLEVRQKKSKGMKNIWQDPDYRANRKSPSEKLKELWADPEYRARQMATRRSKG